MRSRRPKSESGDRAFTFGEKLMVLTETWLIKIKRDYKKD